MRPAFTDEQRLFFEANGYLVLPNVLSAAELGRVREAANRAEAEWRRDATRLGERGARLNSVQAIIEYDPLFLDLLEHPTVFPMVRALLGDDIAMIDNDYYITPPLSEAAPHNGWHYDDAAHDTGRTRLVPVHLTP